MKNKKKDKTLQYYLAILLSGAGIALVLIGVLNLINNFESVKTMINGGTPENAPAVVFAIVCIIIGGVTYKPLEMLRKTLREEVEYDENGVSRKYGSFMNLSAEERKQLLLRR